MKKILLIAATVFIIIVLGVSIYWFVPFGYYSRGNFPGKIDNIWEDTFCFTPEYLGKTTFERVGDDGSYDYNKVYYCHDSDKLNRLNQLYNTNIQIKMDPGFTYIISFGYPVNGIVYGYSDRAEWINNVEAESRNDYRITYALRGALDKNIVYIYRTEVRYILSNDEWDTEWDWVL